MNHRFNPAVRSAFLLLALASAMAGAQTLPYRRVKALGPPVPDGASMALAVSDSGWSVIQTKAGNLSNPARFPTQYYFRSPAGELTPIPVKLDQLFGLYPMYAVISEDGKFAVLGGSIYPMIADRLTGQVRRVPNVPGEKTCPIALADNRVFLCGGFSDGIAVVDLATGAMEERSGPPETVIRWGANPPRVVSRDGKTALYSVRSAEVIVQDIATGATEKWDSPSGGTLIGEEGRYAWYFKPTVDGQGWNPVRHDLSRDKDLSSDFIVLKDVRTVRATAQYLFLTTDKPLVAEDTNTTEDYYVFDIVRKTLILLSAQPGTRKAMGEVWDLNTSLDGTRTLFNSFSPEVADVPGIGASFFYRSLSAKSATVAVRAKSPGGEPAGDWALSPNGGAVVWLRSSADELSLRIVVEGEPTLAIPLEKVVRTLAVSDNGTRVLTSEQGTDKLYLYRRGNPTELDARGGTAQAGHIDPKTGIPVAKMRRFVEGVVSFELLKFDPQTGASGRLDEGAPIFGESPDFSVAAGRAAWLTEGGVRVLDLKSGRRFDFPHTAGVNHLPPQLTSDGMEVSVADLDNLNRPLSTRRYGLTSDGVALSPTYFGEISPDGKWAYDTTTAELVYLESGARFPADIRANLDVAGEPVGPSMLAHDDNNVLWRYQVVAKTLPVLKHFGAAAIAGGRVRVGGAYYPAGLGEAKTWIEYRVDGGEWKRAKTDQDVYTTFKLPDGRHEIEGRVTDALGRTNPVTYRQTVVTDSVPPTVGNPKVEHVSGGVFTLSVATDGVFGDLVIKQPDGTISTTSSIRLFEGEIKTSVSYSAKGTYTFYFKVRDEVGNTAATIKKTFTIQ